MSGSEVAVGGRIRSSLIVNKHSRSDRGCPRLQRSSRRCWCFPLLLFLLSLFRLLSAVSFGFCHRLFPIADVFRTHILIL